MSVQHESRSVAGDGPAVPRTPTSALFRRQFLATGLVFVIATGVLVLSPVTVSTPIVLRELAVLGVGLTLLLAVNAFLLRTTLKPLDGLTALMQRVDLLRPGQRAEANGTGDVVNLIKTFNGMLDRLEAERGASTAQALAAQEGERRRIARELHDEIGQSLTADDGRGTDGAREGAGIRGMRERALLVGADVSIGERPGGGTEVRLTVPVREDRR